MMIGLKWNNSKHFRVISNVFFIKPFSIEYENERKKKHTHRNTQIDGQI